MTSSTSDIWNNKNKLSLFNDSEEEEDDDIARGLKALRSLYSKRNFKGKDDGIVSTTRLELVGKEQQKVLDVSTSKDLVTKEKENIIRNCSKKKDSYDKDSSKNENGKGKVSSFVDA